MRTWICLVAILLLWTSPLAQAAPDLSRAIITLQDEFNGTSLDTTKWTAISRDIPYVGGLSSINPAMVSVGGGTLKIDVQAVPNRGKGYSGGEITTNGKFNQTYGYYEARIKVPTGSGLHPTFWLFPQNFVWPPEIDIAEFMGKFPFEVLQVLHWFDSSVSNNDDFVVNPYGPGPNFTQDFHVYGLLWSATAVTWYVDGVEVYTTTAHVPQLACYVLLTVVLDEFGGGIDATTILPAPMFVDYVRIYQLDMTQPSAPTGLRVQ